MSKADEQMPLEIWTDINGNAARTQFKGGVKYIRADECIQLREQNRVLRGWLGKALDRAREHNEGCLYCGEGEIIDGETTPEHRAECWWYRAQAALTATSQPGGAHEL